MADVCESLWKKFFDDSSQWWDNRNRKTTPTSPDFKHKITKESLWVDGWYNPPWVDQELRRRGVQATNFVGDNEQLNLVRNEGASGIVRLLKACAKQKDLSEGYKLHGYIREYEVLEKNSHVACALITMYAGCSVLTQARQVFDEFPVPLRDVAIWNALIAGYAQQGQGKEALECFDRMQREGCSPNVVTFTCALKACGSIRAVAKGEQIHETVLSLGMLEKDVVLGNTLVDMYARCGALAMAQQVMDELPMRDVVTWNVLMAGYARQGQNEEVLECFNIMEQEGHYSDATSFTCALRACGNLGAATKGEQIHQTIVNLGTLEESAVLGNTLVDMYVKCGALAKAKEVVSKLPIVNVVTWNTLISGYAQQGQGEEALKCFDRMHHEGYFPDAITFTCALKACGSIGAAAKGEWLHNKIFTLGMLEKSTVLGNALVDMYAKCGALAEAEQVLNDLPVQHIDAWNALIAGYIEQGQAEEALKCFDSMPSKGFSPNAISFSTALKACGGIGAAAKGEEIHSMIISLGMLDEDIVLNNTLVVMYVTCGALTKAQQLLDKISLRDVVMWNVLIAGYEEQGHAKEALNCFESMQCEGQFPNVTTFVCALKACGCIGEIVKGKQIHEKILSLGMLHDNVLLGNALLNMYMKCSELEIVQEVLDELFVRDTTIWNALISGFTQQGYGEEALKCLDCMLFEGHSPDAVTFICALRACGNIGAAPKGREIHDKIVSLGMLENNELLGNALVDMYARCGNFTKAQEVLSQLPAQDVVAWNALIAGCTQHGQGEEALGCFDRMQHEGCSPNVVTFIYVLKACGSIAATSKGEQIHGDIVRLGILKKEIVLGSNLIDMYAKCGQLEKAQKVLDELPIRDVVTWNALIAGYAQQVQGEEALRCFDSMQQEGHSPDVASFTSALKACGSIGAATKGEQIHNMIISLGMLAKDVMLGNTLVDMYAKCGLLGKAQQLLNELPVQNVIAWTALIASYTQQGQSEKALKCFDRMQQHGYSPDMATFTCALKACGNIGAAMKGEQIHNKVPNLDMFEKDVVLGNTLLDMYARCGALSKVQEVFSKLPVCDEVAWTVLIAGYAQQGQGEQALYCFEKMQSKGVRPDSATLVCVLNVCSHSALVDQGEMNFVRMSSKYGIEADFEHYSCMVDLFGRAGNLNKAIVAIEKMFTDNVPLWLVLLGACHKWREIKLGMLAFEHALCSDKDNTSAYVCMANIYTAAGMQEYSEKMEGMRMAMKA